MMHLFECDKCGRAIGLISEKAALNCVCGCGNGKMKYVMTYDGKLKKQQKEGGNKKK